ncbi:hypothetical protein LVD13_05145 [Flavobacteriaceae bacterium D16]|nr:hypothetical protein [Flavobacteriaceae bacterium D16]
MRLIHLKSLFILVFIIYSCEKRNQFDEIQGIVTVNDINLKINIENVKGVEIEGLPINKNSDEFIKIHVTNEFSLRGKVDVETNKPYKLSVTLMNESANPLVLYSFWNGPITLKRSFVLDGNPGNPPASKTQKVSAEWKTYETTFKAEENEDSIMLNIFSESGMFYLKEIRIEAI